MFRSLLPSPTSPEELQSSPSSGQLFGATGEERLLALLALSHTPHEDLLYRAMLLEVAKGGERSITFSVRGLSRVTGINSSSSIRRALSGLVSKLSIQSAAPSAGVKGVRGDNFYRIFSPEEIFERRRAFGLPPYPKEVETIGTSRYFRQAVERVAINSNLSRREAQVALACAEGLTNAEIGRRLSIGEQTVKFHLRNIFAKFGVRRRAELITRLLVPEYRPPAKDQDQSNGSV